MNLLIPYVHLYYHHDPLFKEFTYGDNGPRAKKLKKDLKKGDYIFFHTSINGKKYITAYYVVERVLDTLEAIKDKNIVLKYKNPHILEFLSHKRTGEVDDALVFGDPITSNVLARPLLFNRSLAQKLSLNIKFSEEKTETQVIGSATRAWRELTDRDVEILLDEVKLSEKEGIGSATILSTDEVTEIIEKDLENFIEKNPSLIGKSLRLDKRQFDTPVGRIDLILKDEKENLVVVELKLNRIGREAINQLRKYMVHMEKETEKDVKGIIICKGVMPAFEEEFKKLKDIKIFCYGWQLKLYPWE